MPVERFDQLASLRSEMPEFRRCPIWVSWPRIPATTEVLEQRVVQRNDAQMFPVAVWVTGTGRHDGLLPAKVQSTQVESASHQGRPGPSGADDSDRHADILSDISRRRARELLAAHRSAELDQVLGVVERAWLTGTNGGREGRARVPFSKRCEVDGVLGDLRDGILRGVSVGYITEQLEEVEPARKGEPAVYRAVRWQPVDLSLVAIGADPGARLRTGPGAPKRYECAIAPARSARSSEMPPRGIWAGPFIKIRGHAIWLEVIVPRFGRCPRIMAPGTTMADLRDPPPRDLVAPRLRRPPGDNCPPGGQASSSMQFGVSTRT
jgi:hypothetical protein